MPSDDERDALRRLLDAMDGSAPDRLERVAARPRDGVLFEAFERQGLSDLDVALVLASLSRRLAGTPSLTGEELARAAADGSAARLEALGRLDDRGELLSAGLLVPDLVPSHPAEAGAASFRLGEHVLRLACDVFGRQLPTPDVPARGPYRTNGDLLNDLRRLSLHYRRRAARIFHLDPWTGTGIEVLEGTAALVTRAREEARRVTDRLAETPDDIDLPVLDMRRRHGLDLDSLVVLTTVLFQELVEGVGAVDAVDLVKLVSESESELVRRRALLRPLVRKGLLRLEGAYAGKDLTADASLPNEVVARMLGARGDIRHEERQDFRSYLQRLDSSDPFFTDLDLDGSD